MDVDVEGYLQSKGCELKRAGQYELNTLCFFCNEADGKRGRLYINTDPLQEVPGLFHCKLCDERGGYNKIRKHFGDPIIRDDNDETYNVSKSKILQLAAEYYYDKLADHEDAFRYLKNERGLTFDTIESHLLGYADGTLRDYLHGQGFSLGDMIDSGLVNDKGKDFFYAHITIPYMVSGNVVSIRGKEIGGKYLTPKGHKAYLYNSDVTWERPDQLVICEGEFDSMTVEQLGFSSVGVPGANTWQDGWTGYVDADVIPRLYICFDPDNAGRTGAEKLASKLGGRAKIIELPEEEPGNDISDLVLKHHFNREDFEFLLKRSKGGLLISVREAYEEWLSIEGNPDLVGLKFGISKIDEAIKPGILPGQVVVTLAKTGAGKTISMLNFFHRMKLEQEERNFLFISLEQTRNEWFERARRIHKFYNPSATHEDTIRFWERNFMMVDKNRVGEEELLNCVEQYEYEMGKKPDLVSIDYLGYWAQSFPGSTYERVSAAIMACKAIGKELKLPIYAPHQVSRLTDAGEEPDLSAARDSGVIEETADFVFALWAPDQKKGTEVGQRTGDVSLKMLKSRHGGVGTKVDFLFTPKTLAMIPENDPLHYKAAEEIRLVRVGDDLDTVVYRNLTGWDGTIVTEDIKAEIVRLKREGFM